MSKILNTSGEFYSAVFGEKSTGTYIVPDLELYRSVPVVLSGKNLHRIIISNVTKNLSEINE